MNKQKGSILTIAVLSAVIIGLLAGGLFVLSIKGAKEVFRQQKGAQALFLAEAGIEEMMSLLKENFANKDDASLYPSRTLGQGSYIVDILQPSGRVVIESIGSVKGMTRRILVEVKYQGGGNPFDYGVMANEDFSIQGSSTLNSDIHTNGSLEVGGSGSINGDASASEGIYIDGGGEITGDQNGAAENVYFPQFDFNYYYNLAQNGGLYYFGNQTFSNASLSPSNGIVYVNGDVQLSGNSSVSGGIIATGSIRVTGRFTQTPVGAMPALMSRDSDIRITGNSSLNGFIFAASGNISVSGSGAVNGQMMAFGEVTFSGGSDVTLNSDIQIPPGLIEQTSPLKRITYLE